MPFSALVGTIDAAGPPSHVAKDAIEKLLEAMDEFHFIHWVQSFAREHPWWIGLPVALLAVFILVVRSKK